MHLRKPHSNEGQQKALRPSREMHATTALVSNELREMRNTKANTNRTCTLIQWGITFQQSLPGPAWQRECAHVALLAACSPIIPEWWESDTSCGGGCVTKALVRGRCWTLGSLLLQKETHTQYTKNITRSSLPQLELGPRGRNY